MATLKTRITNLLPASQTYKSVTVNQLVARLNRSTSNTPVANATVRGRLSELVAAGVANRETRNSGVTGFYRAS
jgi:hypothetical protein